LREEPAVGAVVINRRDITEQVENQLLLEHQVTERTRELESLYRADETLRRSLRLDDVLQALVDVAADILGMHKSAVLVRDADSGQFSLRAVRGFDPIFRSKLSGVFGGEFARSVVAGESAMLLSVADSDSQLSPDALEFLHDQGVHELLSLPVVAGGEVFAIFGVFLTGHEGATAAERRPLAALTARAGLAIENARLYEAARDVAALEERQRLARELHDSVSQALYAIGLNATAAREILASDPARVAGILGDVLRLTETGLAEMRSLIFELRPESLASEGLVGALEKQTAAVQARYRLAIDTSLGAEPSVSLKTKEAMYRVAQEALHNVAKHAHARHVSVELESSSTELVLRVSDDGRGFDPSGEFPGHLGLRSMRERAEALGGSLDLASAPGAGTHVYVHVPLSASASSTTRPACAAYNTA
jgi:signal transduction histidine kinase